MDTTDSEHRTGPTPSPASGRSIKIALAMVALVGVFYLLRDHWSHVAGNWTYVLLLACPLMHLLHGHGRHHGRRSNRGD